MSGKGLPDGGTCDSAKVENWEMLRGQRGLIRSGGCSTSGVQDCDGPSWRTSSASQCRGGGGAGQWCCALRVTDARGRGIDGLVECHLVILMRHEMKAVYK